MRLIGLLVALAALSSMTAGAYFASVRGWGLPGMLDKPVSIRQQSVTGQRRTGPGFIYFGGVGRRHYGGGFRGGK